MLVTFGTAAVCCSNKQQWMSGRKRVTLSVNSCSLVISVSGATVVGTKFRVFLRAQTCHSESSNLQRPENGIRGLIHNAKDIDKQTDRQTDRQTDGSCETTIDIHQTTRHHFLHNIHI